MGNLITVLLQISSRLRHWKNFENRAVFDEVMRKILLVRFFSGHGVCTSSQSSKLRIMHLTNKVVYNHKKTLPLTVMQKTYFVDFGWAEV